MDVSVVGGVDERMEIRHRRGGPFRIHRHHPDRLVLK